MAPKVSVVTATFNYGRYLAGALDSILAQTYQNWESIVVDDGSEDNTAEVVQPYLADARFRYVRTTNQGQAAAENTGIGLASGQYIAFLDADDLWLSDKLSRQMAVFEDKPEVAVVYSDRAFIDANGGRVAGALGSKPLHKGKVLREIFRDNFICFSSAIVRASVLRSLGGFDCSCYRNQDYDLWLRIAQFAEFDYVDERLVCYRIGHGKPGVSGKKMLLSALRIMDKFLANSVDMHGLSKLDVRTAYAETYAHIGAIDRNEGSLSAFAWLLRALATMPCSREVWRVILRSSIPESLWQYRKLQASLLKSCTL
jgi:glycosyltransferase involved in cell wall biosynthesis